MYRRRGGPSMNSQRSFMRFPHKRTFYVRLLQQQLFISIRGLSVFLSESRHESRLYRCNVDLGGDVKSFGVLWKGSGMDDISNLLLSLVGLDAKLLRHCSHRPACPLGFRNWPRSFFSRPPYLIWILGILHITNFCPRVTVCSHLPGLYIRMYTHLRRNAPDLTTPYRRMTSVWTRFQRMYH